MRKAHEIEQSRVMMLALLSVGEPTTKYCDVWITEAIVYKWQVVQVEKKTVPADSGRYTCILVGGAAPLPWHGSMGAACGLRRWQPWPTGELRTWPGTP